MLETGVVIETSGGTATVRMERNSACAECGLCHSLAHEPQELVLSAANAAGAVAGDRVRISVPDLGVVKASFVAYGWPTLGGVAGGVAGWWLGARAGSSGETGAAIGGLVGLAVSFWLVGRYDKRLRAGWRGPEIVTLLTATPGGPGERERP